MFLVGAGPGDPELLTLKAARILAAADVVLYDRLVSTAILALVPARAHTQYVGKCSGDHHVAQAETEQLLVHYSQQGLQVVRLKGGDPFLFGRGGEEMQTLWRAGIEVEVVPGITAALGCAAYAGIPLTHRDYASSVLFLTGCNQHGDLPASSEALARRDQTLVIYMGLARMPQLCASLQQCGLPADWPVALIAQGTTSSQQVLTGTLATINEELAVMPLVSPTLVVVGRVVEVLLQQPARWVAASVDS
ncbi:uroporphyrinogen-III C-methyltransferase [Permianibacter fluminis]|uniref:uroporphyrinogen-III C-methyltransferase n=1 Tax=Permianibacter fluminis TaxID=2738515 RepID=UPI001B7D81D0|nr:uroporphyrinogen-III C-methyltransferase [Permianibacter fluminis]